MHQWYWSYQYPNFLDQDDEFIEFNSYLVPDLRYILFVDNNLSADSSGLPELFEGTSPPSGGPSTLPFGEGSPVDGDAEALRILADKTQGQLNYNKSNNHLYSLYSDQYTDPNLRYTQSDADLLNRRLTSLNKGYKFITYDGPNGKEVPTLVYGHTKERVRVATQGIIKDIRGL